MSGIVRAPIYYSKSSEVNANYSIPNFVKLFSEMIENFKWEVLIKMRCNEMKALFHIKLMLSLSSLNPNRLFGLHTASERKRAKSRKGEVDLGEGAAKPKREILPVVD